MMEFSVSAVMKEPVTARYVVILESVCKIRIVPIPVGEYEAGRIQSMLTEGRSGGVIRTALEIINSVDTMNPERLEIDSWDSGVFKAWFYFIDSGKEKCVECRPSDGVALALSTSTPIYIHKKLLENAASGKICFERDSL